jgi:hypothetical protein
MIRSFLRDLSSRTPARRTPVAPRNARPSFKPCLTVLEDRTVPAALALTLFANTRSSKC